MKLQNFNFNQNYQTIIQYTSQRKIDSRNWIQPREIQLHKSKNAIQFHIYPIEKKNQEYKIFLQKYHFFKIY